MESADDPLGFSFWLALADGPAFKYQGPRKTVDGRELIPGTWYIKVRYYDRFPRTSASTFKLSNDTYTENAEGLISRRVAAEVRQVRRSGRRSNQQPEQHRVLSLSLSAQEIERLMTCRPWTLCRRI